MLAVRIDRLFHSLVVIGAAMGAGCGGQVETPGSQAGTEGGTSGNSGAAGSMAGNGGAAGSMTGSSGAAGSGGSGASSSTGGSAGSGTTTNTVIDDPSDCEHSSQFTCDLSTGVCKCDPSLPTGPQDCLTTM